MSFALPFQAIGGELLVSPETFVDKVRKVDAFVLDWDGVFNDGFKENEKGSPFSEASSMGLNMWRFSYYLRTGRLPFVAILSGENNILAKTFAQREHLNAVILKSKDKALDITHMIEEAGFTLGRTAFAFDDILDLGAAKIVCLRLGIRRRSSPKFLDYVRAQNLVDYISGCEGQEHAVREISELMMAAMGAYETTIKLRSEHSPEYKTYLQKRSEVEPHFR